MPLRIYNRFLDFQAEIDTYQSLQFGRDFHGVGDFELHVNRYMHEAKYLEKGNLVALNKQSNKVGIILTKEIALDDSGKDSENFKLTGYTIDGIMGRRLTVPPGHTSHDRKTGNTETVLKHYVYNHFVNPVDPSRKMPHIEVAPDLKRGGHIEWESRYKNIADELESISIKTGLGWGLFANFKTKKLIFDVIEAKDLTQDNPYGNHPVFFSPEFETIKSQGFINSDNDLRNVGYVGGQGEGAEREIITLGNNAGWDRIETFIDARDVGGKGEEELSPEEIRQQLEERGQSKMRDMESVYTLEAEIITPSQESPFQYGEDFDLGDKVQVVNKSWGLQMTAPITHFKEIHEVSGFRLEATFGRSRPTLISKMKNKFDELQGVEKQELPALIAVETKKYTNQKVLEEEQERIEQAKANLEVSIRHTEEYAEKKRVESPTPPNDKTVIWVDISDTKNVIWKIWSEEEGIWKAGPGGPQGLPGPPGEDGRTLYTWLKFADSPTSGMSDSPTGKEYIGLAYNKSSPNESANYEDYTWAKTKGDKGIPGDPGADGTPRYTWTKYADDKDGNGMSDSPGGKRYLGLAYNKTTASESNNASDYSWSPLYDNVKPGGRNLILNSDNIDKWNTYSGSLAQVEEFSMREEWGFSKAYKVTTTGGSHGIKFLYTTNSSTAVSEPMVLDQTYVYSIYLKNVGITPFYFHINGLVFSGSSGQSERVDPGESKRIVLTGVRRIDYDWIQPMVRAYNESDSLEFVMGREKLEKSNVASDWSIAPEDVAQDAQDKADAAQSAAESVAVAKANLAETQAKAYADGKVSAEEARAIQDAKDKLAQAKADAKVKADAAETNAKDYAKDRADSIDGKLNNAVTEVDNEGITVQDGGFFLRDGESGLKYNATPRRNIVKDHSFELVKHDPDSMGSTAIKYNWLDMRMSDNPSENIWIERGGAKVAMVWGPDNRSALPIFGEKAICVRSGDYVYQTIYDGVAGGMTFTASGFFKRQHNVVAGGTPRFEIDHINAAGDFIRRLTNTIFPAVPDDYSVVRHAVTFAIPTDFSEGDSLEFKVSGGNNEWVQCDGIQIVEGTSPSVYMPEDSTWEIAKGRYNAIGRAPTLWTGAIYMQGGQTATPTKPLTDCRNGWVLVWARYASGTMYRDNLSFSHIHKSRLDIGGGGGINLFVGADTPGTTVNRKYIYVDNGEIRGNDTNRESPHNERVLIGIFEY
ncbi:siphovirus ReqiPepy6 Gp37-like family protein [Oceanobacillus jordanicus]|nr:siphovirus ReqiPepy6 Gp37-like family protein [Oceanobacillus jordanicus]